MNRLQEKTHQSSCLPTVTPPQTATSNSIKELDALARRLVVETAGHSKIQKSYAYIGGRVDRPASMPAVPASRMLEITDTAIKQALVETKNNRKEAAKRIGISRAYLYKRLGLMLGVDQALRAALQVPSI